MIGPLGKADFPGGSPCMSFHAGKFDGFDGISLKDAMAVVCQDVPSRHHPCDKQLRTSDKQHHCSAFVG